MSCVKTVNFDVSIEELNAVRDAIWEEKDDAWWDYMLQTKLLTFWTKLMKSYSGLDSSTSRKKGEFRGIKEPVIEYDVPVKIDNTLHRTKKEEES